MRSIVLIILIFETRTNRKKIPKNNSDGILYGVQTRGPSSQRPRHFRSHGFANFDSVKFYRRHLRMDTPGPAINVRSFTPQSIRSTPVTVQCAMEECIRGNRGMRKEGFFLFIF